MHFYSSLIHVNRQTRIDFYVIYVYTVL